MKNSVHAVLYAGIPLLLYFLSFFSIFIAVPFIVVYYLKGSRMFKNTFLIYIMLFIAIRVIVILLDKNAYSSNIEVDGNGAALNSWHIFIGEIIYNMAHGFALVVLLRSSMKWVPRILIATVMLFIVTYIQINLVQPWFLQIIERSLDTQALDININIDVKSFTNVVFSIAILFSWGSAIVLLLLNWFIAIMIMRSILRFNMHQYLLHVYKNVVNYHALMPLICLLISGIAMFFTRNSEGLLYYIGTIAGNIFIALLIMYMIYGVCSGYFFVAYKIKNQVAKAAFINTHPKRPQLRCDWYFFFVCVILIIPFLGMLLGALCIIEGISKNTKYFMNKRNNYENNS